MTPASVCLAPPFIRRGDLTERMSDRAERIAPVEANMSSAGLNLVNLEAKSQDVGEAKRKQSATRLVRQSHFSRPGMRLKARLANYSRAANHAARMCHMAS